MCRDYQQQIPSRNFTYQDLNASFISTDIILDSVGMEYTKCASIDIDDWECVEYK